MGLRFKPWGNLCGRNVASVGSQEQSLLYQDASNAIFKIFKET